MKNDPKIDLLILEDSRDDLELILLELENSDFNFNIRHALNGKSFEDLIDQNIPGIILADYNIPGYDISKAIEKLKSKDIDVPFIVVTGALGQETAVDLIVKHKVDDCILKDNLPRLNVAIKREYNSYLHRLKLSEYKKELEKLSLVASHTHNGVVITDKKGQIEWVNEAYENITGYSLAESRGKIPGNFLQGEETDPGMVKKNCSSVRKRD